MLLNILLVIVILVCIALVVAILLQRSEGGALGMSGGGPGAFMTARGTGDFLTSLTQILAGVFFTLCLLMTLISAHERATASVVDRLKLKVNPSTLSQPAAPTGPPPAAGSAPSPTPPTAPAAPGANPLNPFGPSVTVTPAKSEPAKAPASGAH